MYNVILWMDSILHATYNIRFKRFHLTPLLCGYSLFAKEFLNDF